MAPGHSTLRKAYMAEFEEFKRGTKEVYPPPIPFYPIDGVKTTKTKSSKKKHNNGSDSEDDEYDNKEHYITLNLLVDKDAAADDEDNKASIKFKRFRKGTPEEWCDFRYRADEFFKQKDITEDPDKQEHYYRSMFEGTAAKDFERAIEYWRGKAAAANDDILTDEVILARALNEVALKVFAYRDWSAPIQRRYMRQRIPIGDTPIHQYVDRLVEINDFLQYFPIGSDYIKNVGSDVANKLDEEELKDLLHWSQPAWWVSSQLRNNQYGFYQDLTEMTQAFHGLQRADENDIHAEERAKPTNGNGREKSHGNPNSGNNSHGQKRSRSRNKRGQQSSSSTTKKNENGQKKQRLDKDGNPYKRCDNCGKFHKPPCHAPPKNKATSKDTKSKSPSPTQTPVMESHILIKKSLLRALTKKASVSAPKRKVIESDSDEDINDNYVAELRAKLGNLDGSDTNVSNNSSSESVEPYSLYPVSFPEPAPTLAKRHKQLHYTAEVIVEITNREGERVPVSAPRHWVYQHNCS